jgi:antitoxin YefM
MSHITYTELRQNLARYLDEAVETRAPIVVVRPGDKGNVVVLSEDEFMGWQETVHLLSNAANAERLLGSVRAADADAAHERRLAKAKAASTR